MSQFKTQAEIFQALLEGKKLIHTSLKYPNGIMVEIIDGRVTTDSLEGFCGIPTMQLWDFLNPNYWSIKKEPLVRWFVVYEDIPGYATKEEAMSSCCGYSRIVKFIEVEET